MTDQDINAILENLRTISVEQFDGKNEAVKNQFIIRTPEATIFQSYMTLIAIKTRGKIYLNKDAWDYSTTTGKYRNRFLNETKAETEKKIKNGEYTLFDNEGEGVIAQVKTLNNAKKIAISNEIRTKRNTTIAQEINF